MNRKRFIMLLIPLAIIIAACGSADPTPTLVPTAEPAEEPVVEPEEPAAVEQATEEPAVEEPPVAGETPTAGGSLTGTVWTVTELNGQPPLPATNMTAEFNDEGMVSGSAGCNNYNSSYEVDGNQITIGLGMMTQMACIEAVNDQEKAYMGALEAATTFEVSEDGLILFDENFDVIVVYTAVSQGLAGSSWEVIAYNNGKGGVVSVIIDTQITANFDEDGQLTGNASCNNYFGAYEADEENISMGPFGTTRMACGEPEGIMEQESQYLAALETAATYKIDGPTMNMRTAEGSTVANFTRMLPQEEASTEAAGEFPLSPDQISLDTQGVPHSWQAVLVPETPYDQSMPPGPKGLPTHIEILFGITDPADKQPGSPVIYIIPVNEYRKMWDDAGNDAVSRSIQEIQKLNFVLYSPAPTSGYPALPFEEIGGVNDLSVQVAKAVSQAELNTISATQDGFRFVGRWAQDANPITNQNLRYTYQGFTNDGLYLVAAWFPESSPAIPNEVGDVPAEQMDAFNADNAAYMTTAAEALNSLSADQWDPDLTSLDAMVASLQIEGMVASGLVDKSWEWTEGPVQPGSSEMANIEDPSKYQVTYGSDGTISYKADCNSGSMSYTLNNAGMTGGMLAQPGPTTLAECEPGSFYQGFIYSLQAAQAYRVWAGGNEMELVLPAGGGVLLFRNADAPAPENIPTANATVSGMVTFDGEPAIPEGAILTIQIQDTSLADALAVVMGEQVITNAGQFPVTYEVSYDPNAIHNPTYTMSARVTGSDGSLLYINDTSIPVITQDNPTENVEIPVIQIAG